jgi:plasmid maintenance system antidote protein VapI
MALPLSTCFGTSDGYSINLRERFDLELAKDKVGRQARLDQPASSSCKRRFSARPNSVLADRCRIRD